MTCTLTACSISDIVYVNSAGDDIDGGPGIDAGPDVTAPETTITVAPSRWSNDPTPTIEFETNEPATTWCAFNDNPLQICNSPASFGAADGTYVTFTVRAVDEAGNVEQTPAEVMWGVDLVAPNLSFMRTPSSSDNSSVARFWFMGGLGYLPFTYECSLDSSAFAVCDWLSTFTGLTAGSHELAVRPIDHAGNVGDPEVYSWTVDLSTPDAIIDNGPVRWGTDNGASFSFHSPSAGATFECSLDSAAFTTCTSPRVFAGLAEGIHVFEVRAVNGTTDPHPAQWEWEVDTTPPTTTFGFPAPLAGRRRWVSAMATVSMSGDLWASFEYKIDDLNYQACDYTDCMVSLGTDGEHMVRFRARDFAYNPGTAELIDWIVDRTLPDTTIVTGPPAASTSTAASFDFDSNETVTYLCVMDDGAEAECSDPFTTTVAPGAHTLEVRAKDEAENLDVVPATYSWTVTP